MRRRSYLKGLGLGIFVTALILSLTSNKAKGEMSDAEIRKRAAELGMVSEDKVFLSQAQTLADDAQEKARNSVSNENAMNTVSSAKALPEGSVSEGSVSSNGEIIRPEVSQKEVSQKEVSQKEDSAAVAGSKPSGSQDDAEGTTSSDASANKPANTTSNTSTDTSEGTSSDSSEVVVITVNSGESSISVANKMVHAGLITDASQFDSYLVLSGYDRKLVPGSHPIPKGSTASEMGEILTTKQ